MAWVFLFGAVFLEVVATNVLPATQRFTRPVPTVTVCLMYAGTALLLARAILGIDLAIAYTLWCALGIVVVVAVGVATRGERVSRSGYLG